MAKLSGTRRVGASNGVKGAAGGYLNYFEIPQQWDARLANQSRK